MHRCSHIFRAKSATVAISSTQYKVLNGLNALLHCLLLVVIMNQAAGIPCAAVSRLPAVLVQSAIEQAGLSRFFIAQVICSVL
jgi:hypothetical protein